jgi:hypothetical protein
MIILAQEDSGVGTMRLHHEGWCQWTYLAIPDVQQLVQLPVGSGFTRLPTRLAPALVMTYRPVDMFNVGRCKGLQCWARARHGTKVPT